MFIRYFFVEKYDMETCKFKFVYLYRYVVPVPQGIYVTTDVLKTFTN